MKKEAGLPFPFFTKEAGTEGWGCSPAGGASPQEERMESGAPGKERRADVALVSEGVGSEAGRNDRKEESPRRNE